MTSDNNKRLDKALSESFTKQLIASEYRVKNNSNDHQYAVHLDEVDHKEDLCNCPDFTHRQLPCKHILFCRTVSAKPLCAYGAQCNRKNLNHKAEYQHE
jgi:hypothetical protein